MYWNTNIAAYTSLEDAKKRVDAEVAKFKTKMDDLQRTEKWEKEDTSKFPYRINCYDFTYEAGQLCDAFVVEKLEFYNEKCE